MPVLGQRGNPDQKFWFLNCDQKQLCGSVSQPTSQAPHRPELDSRTMGKKRAREMGDKADPPADNDPNKMDQDDESDDEARSLSV